MARKLIDLTGQRYGRWTVLQRYGTSGDYERDGHTAPTWLCQCDCGNYGVIRGNTLRTGNSLSCGCLRKQAQQMRRYREKQERIGLAIVGKD